MRMSVAYKSHVNGELSCSLSIILLMQRLRVAIQVKILSFASHSYVNVPVNCWPHYPPWLVGGRQEGLIA